MWDISLERPEFAFALIQRFCTLREMLRPSDKSRCPPFGPFLPRRFMIALATFLMGLPLATGCGINKSRMATEQLVISDAVDRAVAGIDFSPLSGRKVYLDTKYLESVKFGPHGNVEYVISSLRQQMAAYDCRLQEKPEQAEFIVEARAGVLANDGHEVTYGIPGSAAMSTASAFLQSPVQAPAMPELSLGRRNHQQGTTKIGVFAYDRETREPVWQSGIAKGSSRARDLWVFGLGPFEQHSARPSARRGKEDPSKGISTHEGDPLAAYQESVVFERATNRALKAESTSEVRQASHENTVAPVIDNSLKRSP